LLSLSKVLSQVGYDNELITSLRSHDYLRRVSPCS
jgi:hypothetical protein